MLCDAIPEGGIRSAADIGATAITLHLHFADADAAVARAIAAGGVLERPVAEAFHGERGGAVRCPFGHRWLIGHSIEDVDPAEMQRRCTAMFD